LGSIEEDSDAADKRSKIERAKAAGARIDPAIEAKWLSGEMVFPRFMDDPEQVRNVRMMPPEYDRGEMLPIPPEAQAEMARDRERSTRAQRDAEALGESEADLVAVAGA